MVLSFNPECLQQRIYFVSNFSLLAKTTKASGLAKELLELTKSRGKRDEVVVNALLEMTKEMKRRNESASPGPRNDDEDASTGLRQQRNQVPLPGSRFYARHHMCSTLCPPNCKKNFDV